KPGCIRRPGKSDWSAAIPGGGTSRSLFGASGDWRFSVKGLAGSIFNAGTGRSSTSTNSRGRTSPLIDHGWGTGALSHTAIAGGWTDWSSRLVDHGWGTGAQSFGHYRRDGCALSRIQAALAARLDSATASVHGSWPSQTVHEVRGVAGTSRASAGDRCSS